ncbi:MAG: ATP-binding cassette domain-containing protein [Anaerolineaceae bacterium]|nr:ATP-binding cassette domain-containing protein [Anaerolineaceae bacterium]
MTRLARYLKPFTVLILLSVVLLFTQAMADLSLPDYLSRIVNNGIQQNGIESPIPQAIRQSEMNKAILFMSDADKKTTLDSYTLVKTGSADYDKYVAQYPTLAKEPIYILNNLSQTATDTLKPIISKSLLAVSAIEQAIADPSKAAAMSSGQNGFDLSKLPAGTDPFQMLSIMPAPIRQNLLQNASKRFEAMDESMIEQAAIAAIKTEYTALGVNSETLQNDYVIRTGAVMLLISLLSGCCTIAVGFLSARAAAGMARNLRRDVFNKVTSFSNSEFDKFSVSSLITRSTNDITQLQMLIVIMIRMVIYAPILAVGGVIKAVSTDASMWWTIALAVVALLSFIIATFSIALPKFKIIQKLVDRLNLVTRENLSGMMVIRAFNTQSFEEKRFDKANTDLTSTNLFVNRVMALMMPFMMLIMNGTTVLIIWVGAHQVAEGNMQIGNMIAFMQYGIQVVMAFLFISFIFIILPRASVSADRIADVLEIEPAIQDPKEPKRFPAPFKGTVEFRNVAFRYPGAEEDVLKHLNFTALPGQTTAFIGSTGSGKSTLINLIPRFYDVTSGEILIDGVDIRDISQHDLREKIGYIPQKGNLFSGTIDSNLRYADENASEDELMLATNIAQATNFINEKPEKLMTPVSQGGTNVSGGQRQRLSIARALVKHAPIYIFDDSFSALDFKTDVVLRKALKENTGDSTMLIVAQRISTIKNADQIIVLDEGRIVGMGKHNELMEDCETYREIALSQLSLEELAS